MSAKDKNVWILLVLLLSGLVIGGLIGDVASKMGGLEWLSYGQSFGLNQPIILDLNIINVTFGFMLKINVASILGILIAILVYRKVL